MTNTRLDKLLEMLKIQPDDPFLQYAIGIEYEAVDNYALAKQYFSNLLLKHPEYLPVYYQAGLLYAGTGEPERGIQLLKQGIVLAIEQKENKTVNELRQALEDLEEGDL
jgi:tetratricopeptide (TPR) repeat protein